MVFWKKNKAKEIRNDLSRIGRKVKRLKKLEQRINRTRELITNIKGNIELAKKDILERAIEQKKKALD